MPRTSMPNRLNLRHKSTRSERRLQVRHILCARVQILARIFNDCGINVLCQDRGDRRFVRDRTAHFDNNVSFGHPKLVILLVPKPRTRTLIYQVGARLGLQVIFASGKIVQL